MIRLLEKDKKIPYDLLLLTDETIEAIGLGYLSCAKTNITTQEYL